MNFKLIALSCLTILFTFTSFSQLNEVDSRGRKQGKWAKKYEGKNVFIYIGEFKDDKPVGTFTYYYPSNKVRAVIIHTPNSDRSEAYMYHENKNLLAFGIYRDTLKDSTWINYGPSGRLSFKENYKKGVLHGEKTIYYVPELKEDKSLVMAKQFNYVNGVLDGDVKEYFDDGKIKMTGTFRDGNYNGRVLKYHPNGKLMTEERWKYAVKHGWWKTYTNTGKEIGKKYYYKGKELKGKALTAHMQDLKARGIGANE